MTTSTRKREEREATPQSTGTEVPRRLVVELNRRTAEDLAWLVDEEELNKTTIVNRALQVYKLVMELQHKGGSVVLDDPERGPERMRII